MKVVPYHSSYFQQWNEFVTNAENSNFLFHRNFMEYHQDRFTDASTILLNDNEHIQSVFPANIKDNKIYTHQGLTYGGLVMKERKHIRETIRCFYYLMKYYQEQGIEQVIYKNMPNYIAKKTCDTEHFIMKMLNAEIIRIDTSFVTHLNEPVELQERRKRSIKKAEKQKIEIHINNDFQNFWNEVLIPNLWERYKAKPIHSLEEILLLHSRFPENILQANAYLNQKVVAGLTLFIFQNTVHCQYISSADAGRETGAIDWLFYYLMQHFKGKKKFFSMGTSNNDGNDLNLGVSEYKESFDAKIHAHFHYAFFTSFIHQLEKFI